MFVFDPFLSPLPICYLCSNFWVFNKMGSLLLHTQCYASLAMNISTLNNLNMTVITDMCVMIAKPVATLLQPQNPISDFLY